MQQNQLEGLIAFVAVAEAKGFSAAAVRLGVSPSAVSQSIRNLEARLGYALFNRTTRSVSLTEIGSRYFENVAPCLRDLAAATDELGEDGDEPRGLLRLNVPRAGYIMILQPILRRFCDAYPEVNVECVIESGLIDIVETGFDAGIRFGNLVEKDMIAVQIGPPISSHMVAAPDYISQHGMPRAPHDLLKHSCIGFRHTTTGQLMRWKFERGKEKFELAVSGRVITNDPTAMVQAALAGLGIANTINGYVEQLIEDRMLIRVLKDWSPELPGLKIYYPARSRIPLKLRAFINFLRDNL